MGLTHTHTYIIMGDAVYFSPPHLYLVYIVSIIYLDGQFGFKLFLNTQNYIC